MLSFFNRVKTILAAAFLLSQFVAVVYARFVPTRYFSWAPYTYVNRYRIDATVDGHSLSPHEISARYHLHPAGIDVHSIHNIIDALETRESHAARVDIRLTYTINDGVEQQWHLHRG